ncbi:hypothetical protein WJX74_008492 [Apatococcus lobatus]|uniref:NADP-dependent oxidoreductase domain-containing protein n=2 Tax=Apatococcus TaxID=904362 RepID=A0AAW1TEM5_9CHLO
MTGILGHSQSCLTRSRQTSSAKRRALKVQSVAAPEAPAAPKRGAAAKRIKLGSSDLSVSECCLGTMTWGGDQNSFEDASKQLSFAFDAGVNFIDTAEMYPVPPNKRYQGRTDLAIAPWLKQQRREDVVLASKVSGYGNDWIRASGDKTRISPSQIEQSVEASLQRLGTDHLDLLQIHWPDRYVSLFGGPPYDPKNERPDDVPFKTQLEGLKRLVDAGKVRHVGVSNETAYGVTQFIRAAEEHSLPRIVSIQNCYNLFVRTGFEADLAEVCAPRQCNVGLLAYSPLAGGVLSGKYLKNTAEPGSRLLRFEGYMARYTKQTAVEAMQAYCDIAQKYGVSPTELALAWCQGQTWTACSIIGATSMKQLKENISAFDVELPEEAFNEINEVNKRYRDPAVR